MLQECLLYNCIQTYQRTQHTTVTETAGLLELGFLFHDSSPFSFPPFKTSIIFSPGPKGPKACHFCISHEQNALDKSALNRIVKPYWIKAVTRRQFWGLPGSHHTLANCLPLLATISTFSSQEHNFHSFALSPTFLQPSSFLRLMSETELNKNTQKDLERSLVPPYS